jgi:site-specific DNA-methyltransferase (adenine-specific)
MNKVVDLIEYLQRRGVKITLSGENIRFHGSRSALTPEIVDAMKSHKAEIISYLNLETAPDGTPLRNNILLGDSQQWLKSVPDNSVDLMVSDPPYGMKFMGKAWDKALPKVEIWRECLRVLKPGAFAFVMCIPRQDLLSRMIADLEAAGFVTGFTSIYWTFASGFPKAQNISKAIDRKAGAVGKIIGRNPNSRENCDKSNTVYESGTVGKTAYITQPATEIAKKFDGAYAGFQPKPAVEVILVIMKPLSESGFTNQALSNRKGITWMDKCRIPYSSDEKLWYATEGIKWSPEREWNQDCLRSADHQGRFPANLLVSDCVMGEHSKFFDLDRWVEKHLPFIWVPKASQNEKEAGLENLAEMPIAKRDPGQYLRNAPFKKRTNVRRNQHPTVKPLKLMAYLVTMGSREGDIVLDPFCGSGTTCIAAMVLKRGFIGIEISPEYHEIALKRLAQFRREKAA